MNINCDNNFCIYWNHNVCTLDSISLNSQGFCSECIFVSISDKKLKYLRQLSIKKYYNS